MGDKNLEAYRKTYKLRLAQGKNGKKKTVEVTMPLEVVEKEARKHELTVAEFIEQYRAVAQYNNFKGVLYEFEKIPVDKPEIFKGI